MADTLPEKFQLFKPGYCTIYVGKQSKFILVNRSGTRGLKPYQETAYYFSSRQENAKLFD
jgi:hypothetical protein